MVQLPKVRYIRREMGLAGRFWACCMWDIQVEMSIVQEEIWA